MDGLRNVSSGLVMYGRKYSCMDGWCPHMCLLISIVSMTQLSVFSSVLRVILFLELPIR